MECLTCFRESLPSNFEDAQAADIAMFNRFFAAMIDEGVYFAPSAFEAGFVSMAHTDDDIDATLNAAEKVFKQIGESL